MAFPNSIYWLFLTGVSVALAVLAWKSWRGNSASRNRTKFTALTFRFLGILFVLFALADFQVTGERPVKGANIVAILADNSAGLRIKDNDTILDRGETVRQYLSGRDNNWLSILKDDFQIRNYLFDKQARRTSDFETLDFSAQYSNISASLGELANRLDGRPVAGIVLLTDGISTDAPLSDQQLSTLPPVYPVVLGDPTVIPDLSISGIKVSQSAFGDSPLKLEAGIVLAGMPEQTIRNQLRRIEKGTNSSSPLAQSGSLIEEEFKEVDSESSLSFEWNSNGGGIQFFEIKTDLTDPVSEDATKANNSRLFSIDRGKDTYRVLYVTGRPNWEYKFLNRALAEDSQLDIVGLIRVATREPNFSFKGRAGENSNSLYRGFGREDENERYDEAVLIRMNTRDENELKTGFPSKAEELFAYDAIIIDDLEADFFSFFQQTLIRDFAKQRGGGLLILGGVNALEDGGYENTPIAQALPVYLDRFGTTGQANRLVQWNLSRDGWVEPWMRIRSYETDERQRIQDMPWLRVYNTLQRIKPGAQTLATIEDSAAEKFPALVTRKFGSGRVATLAVGDLWRWGMEDASSQADLAQFWRQLTRWLVTDNPKLVEISATKTDSSNVVVSVTARDEDYYPLQAGTATLTVQRVDAEQPDREYTMQPVSGNPGRYTIELPMKDTGAFSAEVSVQSSDGTIVGAATTGWVNQPSVEEFASLTPNLPYLERIAAATGGEVLRLSEIGRLKTSLESQSAPVMETWSKPLWHNNWLFILALAAFLAEWLMRRKRGLA